MKTLMTILKKQSAALIVILALAAVFAFTSQQSHTQVMSMVIYQTKEGPNAHLYVNGKEIEKIPLPQYSLKEPEIHSAAFNDLLNKLARDGWKIIGIPAPTFYILTK